MLDGEHFTDDLDLALFDAMMFCTLVAALARLFSPSPALAGQLYSLPPHLPILLAYHPFQPIHSCQSNLSLCIISYLSAIGFILVKNPKSQRL